MRINTFYSLVILLLLPFYGSAQLDVQIKLGDRHVCVGETLIFLDSVVLGTPTSYEWISSVATFSSTTSTITRASFSNSGTVILKTSNSSHTFYDTVYVTLDTLPNISLGSHLTVCCDYGDIVLNFLKTEPLGNPATGGWSCTKYPSLVNNDTFLTDIGCALIALPNKLLKAYVNYTYTEPATGCTNSDSISITINDLPRIILSEEDYCQDIGAMSLDKNIVTSPTVTTLGVSTWKCLDSNSTVNKFMDNILRNHGSAFAPDWWIHIDETNYTIQNADKDTITLEFTYRNELGCKNTDTVDIRIWRVPKIIFSANRDLCHNEGEVKLDDLTNINLSGGTWSCYDSTGFRSCSQLGGITGDTINTLNSVELALSTTTPNKWIIRYTHTATGCPAINDTTLVINPLPNITLQSLANNPVCEDGANEALVANPSGGTWTSEDPPAIVGGNQFSPGNATIHSNLFQLYYDYTDNTIGCTNRDSISVKVDPRPKIFLPNDTTICTKPGMLKRSLHLNITATNADGLSWYTINSYGNSSRISLSSIEDGNIDFSLIGKDRDTFSVGVNAGGLGACGSAEESIDITILKDVNCTYAGVDESKRLQTVVYPNPSSGVFTIKDAQRYDASLYDLIGQEIHSFQVDQSGSFLIESKGVYLLKLWDRRTEEYAVKRLIVE